MPNGNENRPDCLSTLSTSKRASRGFYRGRFPPPHVFGGFSRCLFWVCFWARFGAVLGSEALKSGVKTLFIFRVPFWMRFGVAFGMISEAF